MSTKKPKPANKANAQHATGSRSHGAKAAVRHNATKNGLTTSYKPANLQEQFLVTQIAESLWRLLRARGIETTKFLRRMPSTTPAPIIPGATRMRTPANESEAAARAFNDNAHTVDNLRRYEAAIERAYYRAIDHLLKLQKERRATEPKQTANPEIGFVSQKPAKPKTFSATGPAAIAPDPKTQVPARHLVPSH